MELCLVMKTENMDRPEMHPEVFNHEEKQQKRPVAVEEEGKLYQKLASKRMKKVRGTGGNLRISQLPPSTAGKRSSVYRGVSKHRWTGRYEAHMWDKSSWNGNQKKRGKQVYLGAYDEEETAARAYDLAALKYWGPDAVTNFPMRDYAKDIKTMENVTREEYLASLRRKSSGFSRGASKYRGVARHHHNGRWEARIGRVFGNKYLYLGTYSTQEEAAAAYDMAAIEYRGLSAVTNFDLSSYIRWLKPGYITKTGNQVDERKDTPLIISGNRIETISVEKNQCMTNSREQIHQSRVWEERLPLERRNAFQLPPSSQGISNIVSTVQQKAAAPTALGLLLQSSVFRQMVKKTSVGVVHDTIPVTSSDNEKTDQRWWSDMRSHEPITLLDNSFEDYGHKDMEFNSFVHDDSLNAIENDPSYFHFKYRGRYIV